MSIKRILMERDELTESEANLIVEELQMELILYLDEGDMESAFNIMSSIGLEPDYLTELIQI